MTLSIHSCVLKLEYRLVHCFKFSPVDSIVHVLQYVHNLNVIVFCQAKKLFMTHDGQIEPWERLMAGSLAGIASQSSIYPMEVRLSPGNSHGLCLNYLKKMSQTWWSSVGSILQ